MPVADICRVNQRAILTPYYRKAGIQSAIRSPELYEREGGDWQCFPLAEIVKLTGRHAEHVDANLLNLVRTADRFALRGRQFGAYDDAEFALFEHINCEA